ncbi:aspartate racemase [Rhodanobacter thiooxydans LCS2]|nr:aspartate racemase [Rhodanobacter thiooxydans LCS2]
MRTLGLIGGMSWESTVSYYREINEAVKQQLGGLHSATLVLFSVDCHEIEQLQHAGEWEKAGEVLAQAASALERAGAEGLVICTNTMHKVAAQVQSAVSIPLLHIADPTAAAIGKGVRGNFCFTALVLASFWFAHHSRRWCLAIVTFVRPLRPRVSIRRNVVRR